MPIVFNKELGGWGLENPTEEEINDLSKYAVNAVRETIGDALANELLSRIAKQFAEQKVLEAIPTDTMGHS